MNLPLHSEAERDLRYLQRLPAPEKRMPVAQKSPQWAHILRLPPIFPVWDWFAIFFLPQIPPKPSYAAVRDVKSCTIVRIRTI
jgi:hypothetical protein